MKRLTLLSCLFILLLLVISELVIEAEAPVSTGVQTNDRSEDSTIESLIKLVHIYRKAGYFEEALKLLKIALEKIPEKAYQEKLQIEVADLHFWWSMSLKEEYNYVNAIKHLEMAYAIVKIYSPQKAVIALNNIGFFYSTLGQKKKALEYYEKALPIMKTVGTAPGRQPLSTTLGACILLLAKSKKPWSILRKHYRYFNHWGTVQGRQ
jgi:tetratricopeptide (TPR) repeat protein